MLQYPRKPVIPIYRAGGPLARGVKVIFSFSECFKGRRRVPNLTPYDQINGINLTSLNNWVIDPKGMGFVIENPDQTQSSSQATIDDTDGLFSRTGGNAATIIIHFRPYSGVNQVYSAIGNYYTSARDKAKLVTFNIPANSSYNSVSAQWTQQVSIASGTLSNLTDPSIWMFTTGPRGMEIWRDGLKVASGGTSPTLETSTEAAARIKLWEGFYPTKAAPDVAHEGAFSFVAILDRQMGLEEIADFYSDPWWTIREKSIYVPDPFPRFWSPPAPAAAANICTATVAEAEFDVPSASVTLAETVVGQIAEAEFDVPSPASILSNIVGSQVAEAEFECLSPSVTLSKTVGAGLAEAEFNVPNPTAVLQEAIVAVSLVAEAEFDLPQPTAAPSVTAIVQVAEAELEALNASSQITNVVVSDIAEAEFEAPSPTAVLANTAVSEAGEAEFEASSPSAVVQVVSAAEVAETELEALEASSSLAKTVEAQAAEAEFDLPGPTSVVSGAGIISYTADAEYDLPSPTSTLAKTVTSGLAEAEIEAPSPAALPANVAGAQVAETEFEVPNPTAIVTTGELVVATVAEAEFDLPGPDAALSKTVTGEAAESEFDVPSPVSAPANIAVSVTIDAEYEVHSPSSTISKEVVFNVAEIEIEVLSPSITEELSVAEVAEAVLEALSPSLTYGIPEISCPGLVGKIYDLIEKFGKEIYFKKELSRAYDPSTGIGGIETVAIKRKITPPEVKRKYKSGGKVIIGEVEFYLSACQLNFDPKPGLEIIIDGENWEISRRRRIRDMNDLNIYKITATR